MDRGKGTMCRYFRFILFLTAIFSLFMGFIPARSQAEPSAVSALRSSFAASGARAEKFSLRGFASLSGADQDGKGIVAMAERLAASLPMDIRRREESHSAALEQIKLYGQWEDGTDGLVAVMHTWGPPWGERTVVVLTAEGQDGSLQDLSHDWSRMQEAASRCNLSLEMSATVQGTLAGEMDRVQRERLTERVIAAAGGEAVEALRAESLTSVSAYTPAIASRIYSGQRPLNLQVAVRHDSYQHNTRVWIGTPLITTEY